MNLYFNINKGKGITEDHFLSKPTTYIGRTNDNDIVINDKNVSKKHAKIIFTKDLVEIHDLGSTNGIYINNIRIKDKCLLTPGDQVRLGQTCAHLVQTDNETPLETHILHKLTPETRFDLDQKKLMVLHEITSELAGNNNVCLLGEKIFARLKEIFEQDRGYIALFDRNGKIEPVCSDPPDESAPLSKSIINSIFKSGESLLLEDAIDDSVLKDEESILSLIIRSAMCVPLIYNHQILGVIYLDKGIPGAYDQKDLNFLRTIACMLAPIIENARLWTELQDRYNNTLETLKVTEGNLIEAERTAAYVRLAHAMAHEIRNPMMVIGGLIRKTVKNKSKQLPEESLEAILDSVLRVESVLKEVDSFSKIPYPQKQLHRIDDLLRDEIREYTETCQKKDLKLDLHVNSSHVLVPVDPALIRKAVHMIFREVSFCAAQGSTIAVSINDSGNNLIIEFGEKANPGTLYSPFDEKIREKPYSLGLFLNIAHKILSDHGGSLLLDASTPSAYPVIMTIPRSKGVTGSVRSN